MNREVAFCTGAIALIVVVNTIAGGYFSKYALQPVFGYFDVIPSTERGFVHHAKQLKGDEPPTTQNSSRAMNQTFLMHKGLNANVSAHHIQTRPNTTIIKR